VTPASLSSSFYFLPECAAFFLALPTAAFFFDFFGARDAGLADFSSAVTVTTFSLPF